MIDIEEKGTPVLRMAEGLSAVALSSAPRPHLPNAHVHIPVALTIRRHLAFR